MQEEDSKRGGWTSRVRRLIRRVGNLLLTRMELFLVEVQEERLRLEGLLALAAGAFLLAGVGLLLLDVALILAFPMGGRLAAVAGLAVLHLAGAAYLVYRLRRQVREASPPFEELRRQFEKDREWIESDD